MSQKHSIKPVLLQINAYQGSGSIGRIAEQIGERAREAGWECYIASGRRYSRPCKLKEIRFSTLFQEGMHILLSLLLDAHGLGSRRATRRLIRAIEKLHPDVIHLHNVHGYYLNVPLLFEYLKKKDMPIVWTLHDCWPMTGHCAHFEAAACERWKTECHHCPLRKAYPKSLCRDGSRRNFRLKKQLFTALPKLRIVTVSQWLGALVGQSVLQQYPLQVIHNGIDLQQFRPTASDLRQRLGLENAFVLLGVASVWYKEKGLEDFIRLAGNPAYKVVLVGVTEKQRAALPPSVLTVLRTQHQQELAAYYTMADVLVNPTYNDSFPTVNLEALACGTPVVTYRTGGSPEAVDAETGVVVAKGDYDALVAAIEGFRNRPKPSEACRRRAETCFDMNRCAERYLEIFNACRQA